MARYKPSPDGRGAQWASIPEQDAVRQCEDIAQQHDLILTTEDFKVFEFVIRNFYWERNHRPRTPLANVKAALEEVWHLSQQYLRLLDNLDHTSVEFITSARLNPIAHHSLRDTVKIVRKTERAAQIARLSLPKTNRWPPNTTVPSAKQQFILSLEDLFKKGTNRTPEVAYKRYRAPFLDFLESVLTLVGEQYSDRDTMARAVRNAHKKPAITGNSPSK